jgi:hypothetical protein
MIQPPKMPMSYIVTWFALADEQLVDSVRDAVADDIMARSHCQANVNLEFSWQREPCNAP